MSAAWKVVRSGSLLAALSLLAACTGNRGDAQALGERSSRLDPPPLDCSTLNEALCAASASCTPIYEGCTPCPMDAPCPEMCELKFSACVPAVPPDPCAGLAESQCIAPFCQAEYINECAVSVDSDGGYPEDSDTPSPVPPLQPDAGACLTEYIGCHQANLPTSCTSNCDCAVNEYCSVTPTPLDQTTCPCPAEGPCPPCNPPPLPYGICVKAPTGGDVDGGGHASDAGSPNVSPPHHP